MFLNNNVCFSKKLSSVHSETWVCHTRQLISDNLLKNVPAYAKTLIKAFELNRNKKTGLNWVLNTHLIGFERDPVERRQLVLGLDLALDGHGAIRSWHHADWWRRGGRGELGGRGRRWRRCNLRWRWRGRCWGAVARTSRWCGTRWEGTANTCEDQTTSIMYKKRISDKTDHSKTSENRKMWFLCSLW